jgi:hypothetical protein
MQSSQSTSLSEILSCFLHALALEARRDLSHLTDPALMLALFALEKVPNPVMHAPPLALRASTTPFCDLQQKF